VLVMMTIDGDSNNDGDNNVDSTSQETRLTLGLSELSLLNTSLDGLVELRVKSSLRHDGDLVVALDIFLDGLTTVNTLAY
jgi:hypothetical protein